jgi:hypothetical protein
LRCRKLAGQDEHPGEHRGGLLTDVEDPPDVGGAGVTPADPSAVSRRFAELVIRAQARAAREEREHLAAIRERRLYHAGRRPVEAKAKGRALR